MTSAVASCRRSARARLSLYLALFAVLGLGCATHRGDGSPNEGEVLAETAGTGVASVLATVLYAPAKITYAATGTVIGGGAYVLSGGNADVANAIVGPAMSGHYIVTPDRLKHPETLEFVGTGYDVRRVPPEAPPQAADALPTVSAPAPASACAGLGALPSLYFESGKSTLSAAAIKDLDDAVLVLRDCPMARAEIRAYSDALGSREVNFNLSQQRAQAVRAHLLSSGVAAEQLRLMSFGEDQPVQANATKDGRAANRRVEVMLR